MAYNGAVRKLRFSMSAAAVFFHVIAMIIHVAMNVISTQIATITDGKATIAAAAPDMIPIERHHEPKLIII